MATQGDSAERGEDMTVYGVLRGKEHHGMYLDPTDAQERTDESNALFPRGKRYKVIRLIVKGAKVRDATEEGR